MKLSLRFTLCLLALGNFAFAQTTASLLPLELEVPSEKMASFSDYELVTLAVDDLLVARPAASGATTISFRLATASATLPFRLEAFDLRGPDHQLKTAGSGKQSKILPRNPVGQFRGRLQTPTGGTALFTLDDNFVIGSWKDGDDRYNLEPLWRFWPEAPRDAYVMYTDNDTQDLPNACGVENVDGLVASQDADRMMGGCLEVEIALASDFEMYQAFNSNAASLENFILNGLANVQTNYDDEFDDELTFVVVATFIVTSNAEDPWTNSTDGADELLPDFGIWGNNGGFGNVSYDVASLWTNRDLDGPAIGWGFVGAVCANNRYNILQSFTNNASRLRVLWAHELGHNFGSNHDDGNGDIMAPSVNGAITWSQQSQNAINGYYQDENCLATCPNPDPPLAGASTPFSDVCENSLVTFFDESTGFIATRNWQFPGGTPATSTAVAPTVTYPGPGVYTATLSVGNDFGNDQVDVVIRVSDETVEGATVLLYETFDGESADYIIQNPDGANTWEINAVEGNLGEMAAAVNNYDNNLPGEIDRLIFPDIDLSEVANATLLMEYAYRRYSNTLEDELRIIVNTSMGPTTVFVGNENGSGNFATGDDLEDRFFPKESGDWCFEGPQCIEVDLSSFSNQGPIQIVIENENGYGNFMYVDNLLVFGNCSAGTLPVEWLSFTAEASNKTSAQLNWSVNQDEAHAGFTVQRADAAAPGAWSDLGWVPAQPLTNAAADYAFTDPTAVPGTTYQYRLRQEDLDGTTDLSPIRTVAFGDAVNAFVQPNPTTGLLTLTIPGNSAAYQLYDAAGRVVLSGGITSQRAELNLSVLPAGVYVLRVAEEVIRVVKR